jgi:hypothetical protein
MDRRHAAVVTGIHCLQHVECLGAPAFADDNSVRPHAQRISKQLARGDFAPTFDVWWTRFHAGNVRLLKL